MRLLDRYLLRELLIPLAYILGGFIIFWDAFSLFSDLNKFQESRLKILDVLELYAARLPGNLVVILPITLLLALLYALTNHARHHEITAIRAAGVGLGRICAPYFIVGILFSVAVFYMNETLVPDGVDHEQEIMTRYEVKKPGMAGRNEVVNGGFTNDRDGHKWKFRSYNFTTGIMTGPWIIWNSTNGSVMQLIAERAEHTNGVWTFFNAEEWPGSTNVEMVSVVQTNVLAVPEFTETPEQVRREIRFANRLNKRASQYSEIPIADILDYLNLHPTGLSRENRGWLETQLHGRMAAPFTCLVVVLIAIPFGAASGRRNIFAGVASSILICFIYFVLMKVGLALGTGGWLPPWLAAWFPNISFSIAAIWLMRRVR